MTRAKQEEDGKVKPHRIGAYAQATSVPHAEAHAATLESNAMARLLRSRRVLSREKFPATESADRENHGNPDDRKCDKELDCITPQAV